MSTVTRTPPTDHPWRGPFRRHSERSVEAERRCRECEASKPLDAFGRTSSGYRYRTCRQCRSHRRMAWSRANRQRQRLADRRWQSSERIRRRRRAVALAARIANGLIVAPRRWWTVPRVAAELECGATAVKQRIRNGTLIALRDTDGHRWRIDPASVRALLLGDATTPASAGTGAASGEGQGQ